MDDQALVEGSVVFRAEDDPGEERRGSHSGQGRQWACAEPARLDFRAAALRAGWLPHKQRESQRWKAATEPQLVTKNLLGSPSPTLPSLREIKSPRAGRHGFSAADSGLLLS